MIDKKIFLKPSKEKEKLKGKINRFIKEKTNKNLINKQIKKEQNEQFKCYESPRKRKIRNEFFLKQNGVCAICGKHDNRKCLSLDHDHKTKKYRGLLCHRCNIGLGFFGDNKTYLENAIIYLKESKN